MTGDADGQVQMAAALAAIAAYLDSGRLEVPPDRGSRWAMAGRQEAQQSGARQAPSGSGWGRRNVR